jgi:hypothetical protein
LALIVAFLIFAFAVLTTRFFPTKFRRFTPVAPVLGFQGVMEFSLFVSA